MKPSRFQKRKETMPVMVNNNADQLHSAHPPTPLKGGRHPRYHQANEDLAITFEQSVKGHPLFNHQWCSHWLCSCPPLRGGWGVNQVVILLRIIAILFLFPFLANTQPITCSIDSISTANLQGCNDNGTDDYRDDWYTIDVIVYFSALPDPAEGYLTISGPDFLKTDSVEVATLRAPSYHYFNAVMMQAGQSNRPIQVTASFTSEPRCSLRNRNAGFMWKSADGEPYRVRSVTQCSVCPCSPQCGAAYPKCWPIEKPDDPCSIATNHAPDPGNPVSLPVRYIKTVLHIFQKEDPDRLGKAHPTDAGNYTKDHLDVIRSWFYGREGVNGFMANLCDDTTDLSPHMPDSRIRFLNQAMEGKDVFFHPDTKRWGIGIRGCVDAKLNPRGGGGSYSKVLEDYVTEVDPKNPYYKTLMDPETQNAYHIYICAGTWSDNDTARVTGIIGQPDPTDCFYPCPGGFSPGATVVCVDGKPPKFFQNFIVGNFEAYKRMTDSTYVSPCNAELQSTTAALGRQITGEIFHGLSVDHISPLQAHKKHPNGDDSCEDTPWDSDFNMLGCKFDTRCALTQCQIGRMHQFLVENAPSFERFPTCNGDYSPTPQNCCIMDSVIIIPAGTSAVWGQRQLRSNVIVENGASLSIFCDLGMPEGGVIMVKKGGKLEVNNARIYSNCTGTQWDGIVVEGLFGEGSFPEEKGLCWLIGATVEDAVNGIR